MRATHAVVSASALVVIIASCDPVSHDAPEPVTNVREELSDSSETTDPAFKVWFEQNFPTWHAYLGGFGFDGHKTPWGSKTRTYWSSPGESDANAPVIFVRAGDEANPERWVQFRLWSAWMTGDAYFDKLIAYGGITLTDLLAMQVVLHEYRVSKSEPPSIRTLPAATQSVLFQLDIRSRTVATAGAAPGTPAHEHVGQAPSHLFEAGPAFPPLGDWATLFGYPLPGRASGGSSGSASRGIPGNPGVGHGGWVTEGIPNDGTGPNSHHNDPPSTSDLDQSRGVFWGDPPPIPFDDPSYQPSPGELKVNFRCHGVIFNGYVGDCIDLMTIPATDKWDSRTSAFVEHTWAKYLSIDGPQPAGNNVPPVVDWIWRHFHADIGFPLGDDALDTQRHSPTCYQVCTKIVGVGLGFAAACAYLEASTTGLLAQLSGVLRGTVGMAEFAAALSAARAAEGAAATEAAVPVVLLASVCTAWNHMTLAGKAAVAAGGAYAGVTAGDYCRNSWCLAPTWAP